MNQMGNEYCMTLRWRVSNNNNIHVHWYKGIRNTIVSEIYLYIRFTGLGVRFIVLNATFNNISIISWLSVLLLEETWLRGENHLLAASHWQSLSHNGVSRIRTHNVSCSIWFTWKHCLLKIYIQIAPLVIPSFSSYVW
jgi:hypothetical protein